MLSGSVVAIMKMTCDGGSSEGFEQGVRPVGDLVGFVEDVDLVAVAGGE